MYIYDHAARSYNFLQSLGSENTKQLDCNLTLTIKVGALYRYEFLTQSAMARIEMLLTY